MTQIINSFIVSEVNSITPSLSSGSLHRKVNVLGIPMGAPSPVGEAEGDAGSSQSFHVDMYNLALQGSFVDIHIPCEGGELSLQFLRNFSQTRIALDGSSTKVGVLGMGWSSNISAEIVCTEENGATMAVVTDDSGLQYTFFQRAKGLDFNPYFNSPMSNSSRKIQFKEKSGNRIEVIKWHGTTLIYEKYKSETKDGKHKSFYRLSEIRDRNGNAIIYTYFSSSTKEFLVKSIHEKAHPLRKVSFSYVSIGSSPSPFDCGFRIKTITDPLDRKIVFNYSSSITFPDTINHCLSKVTQPEVSYLGQLTAPVCSFTYTSARMQNPANKNKDEMAIALRKMICPDGFEYKFEYREEGFPQFVSKTKTVKVPNLTLKKVTTSLGETFFKTNIREQRRVQTIVTNTDGVKNDYVFESLEISLDDQPTPGVFVRNLKRTSQDVDEVHYRFSADPNQNLERIIDCSGNTIEYQYHTDSSENDPYSKPLKPNEPHHPIKNPNRYQAFNQPSKEINDPNGLNIERSFRYSVSFNKIVQFTNEEGFKIQHRLDKKGNRIKVIEPNNTVSQFYYDDDGFVNKQIDPDGRIKTFSRTFHSNDLAKYKQTESTIEGFTPNEFRNPLRVVHQFNILGHQTATVDAKGNVTTNTLDALNRLIAVEEPPVRYGSNTRKKSSSVRYEYDLVGRQIKLISHTDRVTYSSYDGMGRLLEKRIPMEDVNSASSNDIITRTTYNYSGWKIKEVDGNGHIYTFDYDHFGRIVRKTSPKVQVLREETEQVIRYNYGKNSGSGAFSYNTGWKPVAEINSRGFVQHYQYDNVYRLLRKISRKDKETSLTEIDSPKQGEPFVEYTYDRRGLVLTESTIHQDGTKPIYRNTVNIYDSLGRRTALIRKNSEDPNSAQVPVTRSVSRQLTELARKEDIVTRSWFDKSGNEIRTQNPEGTITEYIYDGAERLVETILPEREILDTSEYNANGIHQPRITYRYDSNGNQEEVIDENHTQTISEFDARNREIRSTIKMGDGSRTDIITSKDYDLDGRIIRAVDGRGGVMRYEYDLAGREVLSFADPEQRGIGDSLQRTQTFYDKNGNTIRVLHEDNKEIISDYDAINRLRFVNISPSRREAAACRSVYDANNNVVEIKYVQENEEIVIKRTFDAFDRLVSEEMPDPGDGLERISRFSYFLDGKVKQTQNPKGDVESSFYDGLGRLLKVSFVEGTTKRKFLRQFTYNKRDELLSIHDELGGNYLFHRNPIGQVSTVNFEDVNYDRYTINISYDAHGNRTVLEYPESTLTLKFFYDRNSRLTRINDGDRETSYAYDANHNLKEVIKSNGIHERREYDLLNRLSAIIMERQNTLFYKAEYAYDKSGSCREAFQEWESGHRITTNYQYDSKSRLVSENWGEGGYTYTYDKLGNRLTIRGMGTEDHVQSNYTYDNLNQLVSIQEDSSKVEFTYDLNGNLTGEYKDGVQKKSYRWDCLDRLIACEIGGAPIYEARYNFDDFKYVSKENGEVKIDRWFDGVSIQELTGNGIKDYVYGVGLGGGIGGLLYTYDSAQIIWDITPNLHGHTVVNSDIQGNAKMEKAFSAFGKIIYKQGSSDATRLNHTKERIASLGLDYHGKRYYHPDTGRYISRDPLGFHDSVNNYQYVNNNPISHIDHEGEWWDFVQGALDIVGAIPIVGSVASVVNAGISVCRGDYEGAAANLAGAVPGLGAVKLIAKAGKLAKKAVDAALTVKKAYDKYNDISGKVETAIAMKEAVAEGDTTAIMTTLGGRALELKGRRRKPKPQGGNVPMNANGGGANNANVPGNANAQAGNGAQGGGVQGGGGPGGGPPGGGNGGPPVPNRPGDQDENNNEWTLEPNSLHANRTRLESLVHNPNSSVSYDGDYVGSHNWTYTMNNPSQPGRRMRVRLQRGDQNSTNRYNSRDRAVFTAVHPQNNIPAPEGNGRYDQVDWFNRDYVTANGQRTTGNREKEGNKAITIFQINKE